MEPVPIDREISYTVTDILHILAPANVGGLESVVENLATGQATRGQAVGVAAIVEPENEDGEFVARIRNRGIPVRAVVIPHRAYLEEVRKLRELLAACTPRVVHTHGYRADVIAGAVARWGGYPTVSTVHGFIRGSLKGRFFQWLQRRSLREFDAVAAVSNPLGRELRESGLASGKVHVVRNAWSNSAEILGRGEARKLLGLPADGFVVGWVGRVSREKGPDVLLSSLPEIEIPRLQVSIIGTGRERPALERRVMELGLESVVSFHGLIPDAAELYRAFDVFVLSSRTEGTPISLFEAIGAGIPVVATKVGGVPDVVRHGEDGLLVPPEDPAALAGAVRSVYEDPSAAQERASSARRRLQREFGPEPWLDRYEEMYARAVGEPAQEAGGRPTTRTARSGPGVSG